MYIPWKLRVTLQSNLTSKSTQFDISECGTSRWRPLVFRVMVASFFLSLRRFMCYSDYMLRYIVLYATSMCILYTNITLNVNAASDKSNVNNIYVDAVCRMCLLITLHQ
jgi:hypothetical protein